MQDRAPTEVETRAYALLSRCGGIEESGMEALARETRYITRRLLDTLEQLDLERAVRVELQQRCETLQDIIGKAAYQACQQP